MQIKQALCAAIIDTDRVCLGTEDGLFSIELMKESKCIGFKLFPIECRKTQTKAITLANRHRCKQHNDQSEFEANTCNWCQARENACGENTIGLGLDSHWLRKWHEFC